LRQFATFEANVANKIMSGTSIQYKEIIDQCKETFIKKTSDYGTAWRVLRTISVVDQIYIKAQRIRTIQEKGVQQVQDDIGSEFVGIINYAIIGLIQLQLTEQDPEELSVGQVNDLYLRYALDAKQLMESKNHDYGEAWRNMSQESLVDLILMKLQRMRQILANKGKTLISEGLDANYFDMINYAVFALILRQEAANR
jgi:Nucleotide modification associated domain 1